MHHRGIGPWARKRAFPGPPRRGYRDSKFAFMGPLPGAVKTAIRSRCCKALCVIIVDADIGIRPPIGVLHDEVRPFEPFSGKAQKTRII